MDDPRRRRAAQVREQVLSRLIASRKDGGLSAGQLAIYLRESFPGSILGRAEVQRALSRLRQARLVRYTRPIWQVT
jgi:hypothetical protein